MTPKDFDKLIVFATMKNGDVHPVALKKETAISLEALISALEGSIRIVETPIDGIKHIKNQDHDTTGTGNS